MYIAAGDIAPFPWTPDPDPGQTGPFVANDDLVADPRMYPVQPGTDGQIDECADGPTGPEDVAFGSGRWLYVGLQGPAGEGSPMQYRDGLIVRVHQDDGRVEEFAKTHGRPLGVEFDDAGNLYVADAVKGLLRISPNGSVSTLNLTFDGDPVTYTDNLHIDSNGAIWFTSPSTRWGLRDIRSDGMETRPTGRLFRYVPKTGQLQVKMDRLMFANGVAMPASEEYVLVAEWYAYRIRRLWLTGENAGKRDIFYDNLPAYPDNLFIDGNGTLWVGLVIERSAAVDALHPFPFLMKMLFRVPEILQPQLPFYGWLVGIAPDGRLIHNLQDSSHRISADSEIGCGRRNARVGRVTGAKAHGAWLYLTSDYMKKLVRISLPRTPAPRQRTNWPFPRPPKPPCGPIYQHCHPERFAG